ncbi:MAG: hypothetical protein QFF03_16205 [Pseudomonadota bacterium]|nr:hypothetical protein [Pseudomonadota bacterium]
MNYCPYCGTSQSTGLPRPGEAPAAVAVAVSIAKAVPPQPVPQSVPQPVPQPVHAAAPSVIATPPGVPAQVARAPARPPVREPVRLRYWLLALGLLWMIWITQRPTAKKIDARIDNAIVLANSCKASEAQAELIALKDSTATPAQLQRLQSALNAADSACERKRARPRGTAKPARQLANQQAQSARNLIADARAALAQGNYKAAADKMEVCAAMVDPDNRECSALKAKAERLQGELQRCLADGREWIGERCQ